ncbi:MAG: LEA type 2 family protein [Bdellovibrionales bacterium]|nr:LEA type 2 family protein [Bdellovibrionales bacterium]
MLEKPKVSLAGISVKDADMNGATLVFNIAVENPNSVEIKVDKVNYKVFLNNKEITQASTDKAINIASKSTGNIDLPLPIEYRKVFSDLKELLFSESASYKIEGNAKMSLFSIPFSKEGSVKLR